MKLMKRNKGFTLIELLVVIAIIGILSAIILTSLNSARNSAQDAKIQSQLASMRPAAEVYFGNNGSSYGPAVSGGVAGCVVPGTLFTDANSGMLNLASSTPNLVCWATPTAWAASAPLISKPENGWCVDSTGKSEPTVAPDPATSITACP